MSEAARTPAVARAFKWSAVTTVGRFALQLGAQVALARMLGPGNFGVYGIGVTILTFAAFLSGSSFSYSLLLLPQVSRDDIRFSTTWQLLAGLLTAVAIYAMAPTVAAFFSEPRLESVIEWMALASLLTAAAAPANCLLGRELRFKAVGMIQLGSYAAGYVAVGIPMALAGYGVSSLAVACVVQAAVGLVASYAARPHPLRPLFFYPGARATLVTGRAVFVTNILNWMMGNLDRVIIGRMLNSTAVGVYNVAYNLASLPCMVAISTVQPTLLGVGANMQQDPKRLGRVWLQALSIVLVVGTPAAFVGALLSADLVGFLYGAAWAESAWILALLFLCVPAWACWGMSTPVLWSTGRKHHEFLLQLPLLVVAVAAWVVSSGEGVRAVAMATACVIFTRAIIIVTAALKAVGRRWTAILRPAARGMGLAVLCGAAAWVGRQMVAPLAMPAASLIAGGATALATGLLVVVVRPQWLGNEVRSALCNLFPALRLRWAMPAAAVPGSP